MISLPPDVGHKIEWCEHLLQKLDERVLAYLATEPAGPEAFANQELSDRVGLDGKRIWQLKMMVRSEPPVELALLAGDFVQNLRGSLDYLARALVVTTGGTPKEGAGGTQFPILKIPKASPPRLAGCSDAAVFEEIGMFQPYQSDYPTRHALYRLNELANEYKHRELRTFTGLAGYPAFFALVDPNSDPIEGVAIPNLRFMAHDDQLDPLMGVFPASVIPDAVGDFTTTVTLDPTFDPVLNVTEELDFYLRFVRDAVIPSFRRFFEDPWPEDLFSLRPASEPTPASMTPGSEEFIEMFKKFYGSLGGGWGNSNVTPYTMTAGLNTNEVV